MYHRALALGRWKSCRARLLKSRINALITRPKMHREEAYLGKLCSQCLPFEYVSSIDDAVREDLPSANLNPEVQTWPHVDFSNCRSTTSSVEGKLNRTRKLAMKMKAPRVKEPITSDGRRHAPFNHKRIRVIAKLFGQLGMDPGSASSWVSIFVLRVLYCWLTLRLQCFAS